MDSALYVCVLEVLCTGAGDLYITSPKAQLQLLLSHTYTHSCACTVPTTGSQVAMGNGMVTGSI